MNTVQASNVVNSLISHMTDDKFLFSSTPKTTIGIVGEGFFSTIRIPKIVKSEFLSLTKPVDVIKESCEFLEEIDRYDYEKTTRQKFIDKVKSKIASAVVYSRRVKFPSKFSSKKGAWVPADTKCREKKIVHADKRRNQTAVAKMKINGFPINEPEELNIFDMITE